MITPSSWFPYSPDFNPIEVAWDKMKHLIQYKHPSLGSERRRLKDNFLLIVKKAWNSVASDYLAKRIETMPSRYQAVTDGNGRPTKY